MASLDFQPAPVYWLFGCFLDGVKFTCRTAPASFKDKEGGDLITLKRRPHLEMETGVVLGVGLTKYEARDKANHYLTGVGKFDGVEDTSALHYESTQDMGLSEDY